ACVAPELARPSRRSPSGPGRAPRTAADPAAGSPPRSLRLATGPRQSRPDRSAPERRRPPEEARRAGVAAWDTATVSEPWRRRVGHRSRDAPPSRLPSAVATIIGGEPARVNWTFVRGRSCGGPCPRSPPGACPIAVAPSGPSPVGAAIEEPVDPSARSAKRLATLLGRLLVDGRASGRQHDAVRVT